MRPGVRKARPAAAIPAVTVAPAEEMAEAINAPAHPLRFSSRCFSELMMRMPSAS